MWKLHNAITEKVSKGWKDTTQMCETLLVAMNRVIDLVEGDQTPNLIIFISFAQFFPFSLFMCMPWFMWS